MGNQNKSVIERGAEHVMISYYTALSAITWTALAVLCILAYEDVRISASDRRLYYGTYAAIALSLLAEWTGVMMSGHDDIPTWVMRFVKCCDYAFTPMAGGALAAQMRVHNRLDKTLAAILIFNTVFQVVSAFTGWMVTIGPHNTYVHGPLYIVYMGVYMAIIVIVVLQFLRYGRSFPQQNRLSLWASAGVGVAGILAQEFLGGEVRTAYIALTLATALLYIHSSEFAQQRANERIQQQQRQLTTDVLTGALSRHAYARVLDAFSQEGELPDDLVVFSIDANGLKLVNDSLGHEAGDELLQGGAECIMRCFQDRGGCYRVGGDEFVVLAHMSIAEARTALRELERLTSQWHGDVADGLSLSAGFAAASEHPGLSCEELVVRSDEAMYAAKAAYYRRMGKSAR